jgi:saccharopine dehydrogenase-like NADP-dependent oxidoreductase
MSSFSSSFPSCLRKKIAMTQTLTCIATAFIISTIPAINSLTPVTTSSHTKIIVPPSSLSPSLSLSLSSHLQQLHLSLTNNDIELQESTSSISFDNFQNKKILVVGGSGRVGGSVVCKLLSHGAKVTVGGTQLESFQSSKDRWQSLYPSLSSKLLLLDEDDNGKDNDGTSSWLDFAQLDREDTQSVSKILKQDKYDLVVHTAGPFQGKVQTKNGIIEAAIENKIPYIDVCDDYCTATAAKTKYNQMAIDNQVPCIISTGCWPGVSSLMAKQLTSNVLKKNPDLKPEDLTVDFSFFTAGSGGAGSTLLVATFLILAEKSLMIVNGRRREVAAMKDYSKVNFGSIVGDKDVAHLNLLEAASVHDVLGIGNVKTLFGTAPGFWNTLLGWMAQLPSSLLSNEPIMEKLALFSLPIVRIVDYFAGATNAMRCDVSSAKDASIQEMALYAHENLEPCVGECVVGFCAAILGQRVQHGVYFPEEAIEAGDDVASVLRLAAVGAHTTEIQSNSGLTKETVWGLK